MCEMNFNFFAKSEMSFRTNMCFRITGHRGLCSNPCNWYGRYWMPTMVGDP